ncbi:epidermal growth factor-like protein 8 [Rhopilema esculentum]|uniref:epidermal growth factor-like protein 8 n=1 Tax=Rhopilema esculentum TaxID=499914 RepID=UPI0031E41044
MNCFSLMCVLVFLLWSRWATSVELRYDGKNVCSRPYIFQAYHTVPKRRIQSQSFTVCCPENQNMWGIRVCVKKCTKYRTFHSTYYVSQLKVIRGIARHCCTGYARRGTECPEPICRPPCKNGYCIAPNQCFCKSGYSGRYCQNGFGSYTILGAGR